jgi:hypothetical protein
MERRLGSDEQISRAMRSNRISPLSFADARRYIPATAEF